MLSEITAIELQGANFMIAQRLPLLLQNGELSKASLIYGRNGSGKSTIAKAFKKIKGEVVPSIQAVTPLNIHNLPISVTPEEQNHIFVFDEEYVNTNVRVQENGLDSIVMLGEQVGLNELITIAESDYHAAEENRNLKKIETDEYKDSSSNKSPQYYIEKMKSALRGDTNWAGRDKVIKGHAINSSVSDGTYLEFVHLCPAQTRDELILNFEKGKQKLIEAKSGIAKITTSVPTIPEYLETFDAITGNNLLKKELEHPELTERERYLLTLVQNGKGGELKTTAQEFVNPDLVYCPKCHQTLSEHYKTSLITSINRVLSEEVKSHQAQLSSLRLSDLVLDLSTFHQLEHYPECNDSISEINRIICHNNTLLDTKIDDPYTPITEELESINDAKTRLKIALQQLETDRTVYNQEVTDSRTIITTLSRINSEIAYYDVIEYYHQYVKQTQAKQTAEGAYQSAESVANEKKTKLDELNAQRERIDIAIDVINEGLKYIFFSENRMQIQVVDGSYKLLTNGHSVRPKDISVGERNIIGLCYFFTSILQRKNRADAYNEEYLLVIDDPVSSFDFENKVGILSYLKYQLGKYLLGNRDTRALLFTHDLMATLDIEKMLNELVNQCKVDFNGQGNFAYAQYELRDCNIDRFNHKRNEYTELMKLIYEYGNGGANEQSINIGNIMRQVLEAFSTFEYKLGIEKVSTDDTILAGIELETDRIHYKNLMYRLVLNEGSHRLDQTRNMRIDFISVISETERRRTAKEILCFIYLLNRPHIMAHLGNDACQTIASWCEEIRS